jgi:hypothetical protein
MEKVVLLQRYGFVTQQPNPFQPKIEKSLGWSSETKHRILITVTSPFDTAKEMRFEIGQSSMPGDLADFFS